MFCIPGVDAGQIDVFPAQRRYVLEQVIQLRKVGDGPFDIDRIPVYDRTDDEVEAGGAWLSNDRSRISPRSWKKTARFSLCAASPLLRPAWQRRRCAGLEYHSIMKSERSIRPSSRSALASWLSFGDADSFFRIVDGTTDRVVIDAAR